MHFNKRKYLAAILSMAFAMSLLLNSFSVQTFALDSLAEHEDSAQEQEGEMSVPAQDAASQPQAAAEDLTEQDEAQLQLKMQIADLLEQSAQVGQMTEQELETVQEQIQAVTVQPLAQQEEAEPDLELETMLEQLANAQAAVEDMSMAYQAQREGWLDQLPQTGKENSWRYQNGERLEQNAPAEIMTLSLTEGVTVFNSNGYWGIDVSHHQGEVNWEAVKAAGIDFAVIRCGYGDDLVSQDDRQWHRNVSECERLGIPYGVYLYSYATDTNMAASEAAHTLRLLEGHNPDLPVFYDMEENRQLVLGASGLAELARTYCDTLVAAGYDVGVYASLNWWQYYLTDPVFENWYRWIAEWRSSCTYTGRYEMWQYTDCGTISGINGVVDMNYWYGNMESWMDKKATVKEGIYSISTALTTGKVLDVSGGSYSNGAAIQIYQDNNSRAQQFIVESAGSGYYTLTNVRSGKCLSTTGNQSGALIKQSTPNGSDEQQWYFVDAGNGKYMIRSKSSGLYLDVAGGKSASGTKLQLYRGNLTNSQKFALNPKSNSTSTVRGTYTIESALKKNQVLDITGGSYAEGAKLQLYADSGSRAQQFIFEETKLGYYTITNVRSGKVLEVTGSAKTSGATVQQAVPNGSDNQEWYIESAGNGYYCIRSKTSSLYLDIKGGNSQSGAKAQVYTYNGTASQRFKLKAVQYNQLEEGVYTLATSLKYTMALDITNGSMANGAALQIYTGNGSRAQQFRIKYSGNGYYKLINIRSGKALTAQKNSGTLICQQELNGSNAQEWYIESSGRGLYRIRSKMTSLYMDVTGGKSVLGTKVQSYKSNETASQKFKLVKVAN